MKVTDCCRLIALILCLTGGVVAQSLSDLQAKEAAAAAERQREAQRRQVMEAQRAQMEKNANARSRADTISVKLWLESQLPGKEKKRLASHPEIQKQHREFLKQPDTGLFKLIALTHRQNRTISVDEMQAGSVDIPIRGGGSFYSFSKHRHDADEWAQIRLLDGRLQSGLTLQRRVMALDNHPAPVSQFMPDGLSALVVLGNVPLEEITLESPGVKFLREMIPPVNALELQSLNAQLGNGLVRDTYVYRNAVRAVPEVSYVMRTVIYKQADLLLAFRIVRQDADGSLHILWKQLQRNRPLSLAQKTDPG
jgi:hypothetical protein